MSTFVLFETALGLCLFEVNGFEEIQQKSQEFQNSVLEFKKIKKLISLKAFDAFQTSDEASETIKAVSERILNDKIKEFLQMNLPKSKKSYSLILVDSKFAKTISQEMSINIQVGDFVNDIERAIRYHIHNYLKITEEDLKKAELGLGHSYSRGKCMFDVNRQDKPIIQSIALIDQLDKNINSFCMRIKEWFGWHFPELSKIVNDNQVYVKIVKFIQTKSNLIENQDELLPQLEEITLDETLTKQVYDAATSSMGGDLNKLDQININYFCDNVLHLIKYREELSIYLREKMRKLAPNLSALIGEIVSARLISHSGSLSNLAKYPASTIQILGAEKALFRALKTRGKTPKYGLLYHSSYIGKAQQKNKGKISRYLANKIAICSRIDFFSSDRYDDFGVELRNQIEERLKFLSTGVKPRKNVDVMKAVSAKLQNKTQNGHDEEDEDVSLLKKKKKKAKKSVDLDDEEEVPVKEKSKKKKKKVVDSDEE